MLMTTHRTLRCIAPAVVSILCLCGTAAADKLEDFKHAAANKGCDAIPYSSERSSCTNLSSAKERACQDFSCPLDTFKKKLETLATKKKNLEEARSRKNESAAKDLEKKIAELEEDLKTMKRDAKPRVERANLCVKARQAVQAHFDKIEKTVKSERDETLKSYITKLVEHYGAEKIRHVAPIRQVEQARAKCEQIMRTSY
jgi:DNA repair exonuclease SbcCD ATPase subunit